MVSEVAAWVSGYREAAQVQVLRPADLDEASRSSMNQRCSSVALPGMSVENPWRPLRPKERPSPCSGTLSYRHKP